MSIAFKPTTDLSRSVAAPTRHSLSSPSFGCRVASGSVLSKLSKHRLSLGAGRESSESGKMTPGIGSFGGFDYSHHSSASVFRTSAVRHLVGSPTDAHGFRFAVVVARFNEIVTRPLLDGALTTFKAYSVADEDVDVVWVPGSFEIGVVAATLANSAKYDAVLCIGAVIRGDTTHYEAVANSAASGVLSAAINSGVPCIFGVLTCETMEQALNRAGGKSGNKGSETALTAIEMASLFKHHLKK